ncbi:MAG: hypothetical protein L3J96_04020 [Thermoplasmata archaeon]|nr:hypothetical protein [Thermoplasmata archaeon]
MTENRFPMCAWQGVDVDTDKVLICHQVAAGYSTRSDGVRVYGCLEHASHTKLIAKSGEWDSLPPYGIAHVPPLRTQEEIVGGG